LKPPIETAQWPNLNSFDSWMAEDNRFLEFDGQNQTLARVG
jgi:hypothetical protein